MGFQSCEIAGCAPVLRAQRIESEMDAAPVARGKARLFEPAASRQANGKLQRRRVDRKGAKRLRHDRDRRGSRAGFGNGGNGLGNHFGSAADRGLAMLSTHAHGPVAGERSGETRQQRGKEQQQLHDSAC
jgi:hypothetical protein